MNQSSEFGIIGMGTMGKSLALNLASKQVAISIYNRHLEEKEVGVAKKIIRDNPDFTNILGFDSLADFISSLEKPRKILLMIPAGNAVDTQVEELLPLLSPEDVIIDGGNSFYKDTTRRFELLSEKGINFVGAGISGGEEGARNGPSIMPGGSRKGFEIISKYLNLIAARDKNGIPCTAWIGSEGAGHFVKMVHNSIEYAEMQLLSEVYYLLRFYCNIPPENISEILQKWAQQGASSYLLEITINILKVRENGLLLLDYILDQAEQKGTGNWSVKEALDYGLPYGPLSEAVMARFHSSMKSKRTAAANLYQHKTEEPSVNKDDFTKRLLNAYQASRIVNHDIGFNLIKLVSEKNKWNVDLSEIARIWTNGCIIRSELMEKISMIYKGNDDILTSSEIISEMKLSEKDFSYIVSTALQNGYALPSMSSALNNFLSSITTNSPANLIQAQRDYFGAHTYRRTDSPEDQYFHTLW